jgi:hypothetical protein
MGSRSWSLFGILAAGLIAGAAITGYAMAQRSTMRHLARQAYRMGDGLASMGGIEVIRPLSVTSPPSNHSSNHRRKTAAEV